MRFYFKIILTQVKYNDSKTKPVTPNRSLCHSPKKDNIYLTMRSYIETIFK